MPQVRGGRPSPLLTLGTACFLSGLAALVYQVLWTRQLALVMGTTMAAVSTVVATFMAGLGLGSALAARLVDRAPRAALPRLYAGLEWGIAAFALALPFALRAAAPWLATLYRSGEGSAGLVAATRVLTSAAALLLPTTLMGATLPVLTSLVAPGPGRVGRTAGFLYAANTFGAVAGSLGSALLLLPALGLSRSNLLAVALNAAAGAIVLAFGRTEGARNDVGTKRKKREESVTPTVETLQPPVVLAVIALSGLGALAHEVAWTRALILLIGPTSYAFAFVLTAVIAGIALGSAAASRWADRTARAARALAAVEIGIALSSIAVTRLVGALPVAIGELVRQNADRMGRLMAIELAGVFLLLLLPCALFGAAFPLAVGLMSRRAGPAASVGGVYAWNTAGAIAGALLAGFAALPALGLERTLYAAAGVHALAGGLALLGSSRGGWRPAVAFAALASPAAAAFVGGRWDPELLSGGAYKYAAYAEEGEVGETLRRGELLYYREGRTATVSVKRVGGRISLAIDGKVDATSSTDMLTQRLLAHVPLLLHPSPRAVCVIGLGSGVTAGSALAHPVASVDAVEISPEVVDAAAFFRHVNRDALADPRLRLVVADGRNHLLLTEKRYDVIISEPSNPWMAGVSALFTRDFFRMARERLAEGGLFCQWAHIYNMDGRDLRTVVASFTDAFPDAALFLVNEGDILLIGSRGALPRLEASALSRRMAEDTVRDDLAGVGVKSPFGLASLYALGGSVLSAWTREAPRHTDDRPVLEFRAPRSLHADTARANWEDMQEAARRAPPVEPYTTLTARPTTEQLMERAAALEAAESFGWAMALYRQAVNDDPHLLPAYEGLVRTAAKAGHASELERELAGLAEKVAPIEARIALALLHYGLERPRQALAQLEAAARLGPMRARGFLLAAEIQEEGGNLDASEALARSALALEPRSAEAEAILASVQLRRGWVDLALARAEAILARDPRATRALEVAAIARAQKGDREGARKSFEALLAVQANGWSHLNNYGVFEMEGKDYRAAAQLFERAVDIYPRNVHGWRGLREAALALGDRPLLRRAESQLARLGFGVPPR